MAIIGWWRLAHVFVGISGAYRPAVAHHQAAIGSKWYVSGDRQRASARRSASRYGRFPKPNEALIRRR